ncbi:MAG: DoxX family protein [Opitutales bacterium]|nr:DoxX family protein [Opitutales bacterium]MBR7106532.1 DoxX family protein [Opitutales bacterium]
MRDWIYNLGVLVLRIVAGGMMFALHGLQKIEMIIKGEFGEFPNPIGLGSALSLYVSGLAESLIALFLLFGFWTRFSALILSINMFVAIYWHCTVNNGGVELPLIYMLMYIVIAILGGGDISIDSTIQHRKFLKNKL